MEPWDAVVPELSVRETLPRGTVWNPRDLLLEFIQFVVEEDSDIYEDIFYASDVATKAVEEFLASIGETSGN